MSRCDSFDKLLNLIHFRKKSLHISKLRFSYTKQGIEMLTVICSLSFWGKNWKNVKQEADKHRC